MKTLADIYRIVNRIKYKDWHLRVDLKVGQPLLQVQFSAPDNDTGEPALQSGRKWFLSWHMTDSEIVQTALKAVLAAEEHEAREQFLVDGLAIFGPHIKLDTLLALAGATERRVA